MKNTKYATCPDCKMPYRKAAMYRIRPPQPLPVFFLCQPCWDKIIGAAVFQAMR